MNKNYNLEKFVYELVKDIRFKNVTMYDEYDQKIDRSGYLFELKDAEKVSLFLSPLFRYKKDIVDEIREMYEEFLYDVEYGGYSPEDIDSNI